MDPQDPLERKVLLDLLSKDPRVPEERGENRVHKGDLVHRGVVRLELPLLS